MRYIGILLIILTVLVTIGCQFDAKGFLYTISFVSTNDYTVILNGSVVDHTGFSPRAGVNRVMVLQGNQTVWVGQWELSEGTVDEFIQFISTDENLKVTHQRNRSVAIEFISEGL